ncbi:hypothetical protein [Streptomyces sp. NPDC091268]|uniref:hypothetical protein n=1 Tax=Streptomyces sp. NPDC091268 TaxID=3365979 RepID=UPI00380FB757
MAPTRPGLLQDGRDTRTPGSVAAAVSVVPRAGAPSAAPAALPAKPPASPPAPGRYARSVALAEQQGALLGARALTGAASAVLRATVGLVAGQATRGSRAGRRWKAPLSAAFADLLACEALVTVGLRACELPQGSGAGVRAAAGYTVPIVVADVLDELQLVMTESRLAAPDGPERRMLADLLERLDEAGASRPDVASRQADVVRELPALAAAFGRRWDAGGPGAPGGPAGSPGAAAPCSSVLFRLDERMPARIIPPEPGSDDTLVSALTAAHTRFTRIAAAAAGGTGEDVTPALARVAGRLLSEQRALVRQGRLAEGVDPADPRMRALADRQAMVLLAAAVLGVQGAAADTGRDPFLGGPHWALLASARITERLGIAPDGPGTPASVEARDRVWAELADRDREGLGCDIRATGRAR